NIILVYNFNNYIVFTLPGYKGSIYNGRIFSTSLARSFSIPTNYFYLANSRYNYSYRLFILYRSV
ncbi:hypothetical protein GE21DRAFT_1203315, partial [Neurospora crassa]